MKNAAELNRATVRMLNGWWLLEVPSPLTTVGKVVQGEYRTAAEAEKARDVWNKWDVRLVGDEKPASHPDYYPVAENTRHMRQVEIERGADGERAARFVDDPERTVVGSLTYGAGKMHPWWAEDFGTGLTQEFSSRGAAEGWLWAMANEYAARRLAHPVEESRDWHKNEDVHS